MKKVLQHGYDKFTTSCKKCGCFFAYELSDVDPHHFIECPECAYINKHESTNIASPDFWKEFMSDAWAVKDYPVK